jgi:glycerophosphoryl diester phosphodiesterase
MIKHLSAALAVAFVAAFPAIAATPMAAPAQPEKATARIVRQFKDPNGPVMIVAHRGCHNELPENSIAGFKRCIMFGIDVIETDVQHTKDGVLILMHDQTVDRMTDGKGRIDEMMLADLKKLRLRMGEGGPDAPLTEEHIPTFEEGLAVTKGKILVDLDAKGRDLKRVWADSLPLLERLGMLDEITVKMTADRDDALMEQVPLLKRVNYLQRAVSMGSKLSDVVRTHAQYKPLAYTGVFINLPWFTEGVPAVRASGARAWAEPFWGATAGGYSDAKALLDPDANWGALLDAGATAFLTNEPEALLVYLVSKGKRRFNP